jgi:capsular exopolysaccharide synthesis family protein
MIDDVPAGARAFLGLIRRQYRLIVVVMALVTGGMAAFLYAMGPVYQATALLTVDPRQTNVLDPESQISLLPGDGARVESEVEILRSDATLLAVVRRENLIADPEFADAPGEGLDAQSWILERLRDRVTIARRGLTYVIGISVTSSSPERAAALANAVAEVHIAAQVRARIDNALVFQDALARRLSAAADELAVASAESGPEVAHGPEAMPAGLLTDAGSTAFERDQEMAASQALYGSLLARLRAVEAQVDLQLSDTRLASEALPPAQPSSPHSALLLALAGFASLGLGLSTAFLYENYVGGITSEAQIESALRIPMLASLPRLPSQPARSAVADEIIDHPLSAFSEAIRRARLGTEQLFARERASDDRTPRSLVILVTSARPGEGKTSTAIALARAYAVAGRRTLLVDCDLRRPSVHEALDLDPQVGLVDYLSEPATETLTRRRVVTRDAATGLDMVLGSKASRAPTDKLFETERFRRLVRIARERFDVIVLDSPPVLPIVDAQLLMAHADVLVLAMRWASTAQSDVRAALQKLLRSSDRAPAVGAILTQVGGGSSRAYEAYYRRA